MFTFDDQNLLLLIKGLLAGAGGLLVSMMAAREMTRNLLFSNVAMAVIMTYLVSVVFSNFWILGDRFTFFVALLVIAVALIAIVSFLREPPEPGRLNQAVAIFFSGGLGIILGMDMVITGFFALLIISFVLAIGKSLIREP